MTSSRRSHFGKRYRRHLRVEPLEQRALLAALLEGMVDLGSVERLTAIRSAGPATALVYRDNAAANTSVQAGLNPIANAPVEAAPLTAARSTPLQDWAVGVQDKFVATLNVAIQPTPSPAVPLDISANFKPNSVLGSDLLQDTDPSYFVTDPRSVISSGRPSILHGNRTGSHEPAGPSNLTGLPIPGGASSGSPSTPMDVALGSPTDADSPVTDRPRSSEPGPVTELFPTDLQEGTSPFDLTPDVTPDNSLEAMSDPTLHTTFSSADLRVLRNYEIAPTRFDTGVERVLNASTTQGRQHLGLTYHLAMSEPGLDTGEPEDGDLVDRTRSFDASLIQLSSFSFLGIGQPSRSSHDVVDQVTAVETSQEDVAVVQLSTTDAHGLTEPLSPARPGHQPTEHEQQSSSPEEVLPAKSTADGSVKSARREWSRHGYLQSLLSMMAGSLGALALNRRLEPDEA